MGTIIAFCGGVLAGFGITLFIVGATRSNRDFENYMEGYLAGKQEEAKGGGIDGEENER